MRKILNPLFVASFLLAQSFTTAWAAPSTRIQSDSVVIGNGASSSNKNLEFNLNLGAANPKIRANSASSQLEFANDGVNFSGVGSGSGGGTSGKNYLSNPGFETGVGSPWVTSGATATVDTSDFHEGSQSMSLALSAAGSVVQDITSTTNLSGTNLESGAWIKTTKTGVSVCARQNGATLSGSYCNAVPSSGVWTYVSANSVGPALGTSVGIAVVWTVSSGTVQVDQAYVGQATNLSQVSQAKYLGSITISGCTAKWSITTTSSSFQNFPAQTSCVYTPESGSQLQAASTMIPGFIIPSIGPGHLEVVVDAAFENSGYGTQYRFYDGTNSQAAVETSTANQAGGILPGALTGHFNYSTPQTNLAIRLQGFTNTGNVNLYATSNGLPTGLSGASATTTFKVYYFPTQSQSVANACGSTGSCVNHLSAAVTSVCSSTPCAIASQNVPWVSSITRSGTGNYTVNFNSGFFSVAPICSAMTANGAAYLVSAASNTAFNFISTGSGGSSTDSQFSVFCDKQGSDISYIQAPVVVGSVTSNSAGAYRVESYEFRGGASSCTIARQSESGVACVRNSTGNYTVTFGSAFSAIPVCTSAINGFGGTGYVVPFYSISATGLNFGTTTLTSTLTDNVWADIICMGPK